MKRLNRLMYCCAAGTGTSTDRTTISASGMNRPSRCGRESTTSRTYARIGPRSRAGRYLSSPDASPARRFSDSRRRCSRSTSLSGRFAFASLAASRCVRGGGAAGPRRRPSASRRLGVGRPLPAAPPATRTSSGAGAVAALAGGGGERRSRLTDHSVTGLVARPGTNRSPSGHGSRARTTLRAMRGVIAPDALRALHATGVAEAVVTGWRRGAPADELVVVGDLAGLDPALDGARLVVTGEATFDWRSLRGSHVAAVAGAAVARGVPCLVLAQRVSAGRREAAAVGGDAAYAVSTQAGGSPNAAFAGLAEEGARRWSR